MTIHQTNDVIVRDVVGYSTYGHGFFIEDGIEQNNTFDHNLGILVKPGIVLPTDRHYEACVEIGGQETFYTDNDGKRNYEPIDTSSCEMLSGKFLNVLHFAIVSSHLCISSTVLLQYKAFQSILDFKCQ